MPSRGDGVMVRYRLSVVQVIGPVIAGGLTVIGLGTVTGWGSNHGPSFAWQQFAGILGGCVLVAILSRAGRAAVTLTPSGVSVRRGWRTWEISWPDVTSVTVESTFPGFRVVVLTTVYGDRIKLPTPVRGLDFRFAEKAGTIRAYWVACRQLPAYEPPFR